MLRQHRALAALLNGYSGFFPRSFLELTEYAKSFPDDALDRLLQEARRRSDRRARWFLSADEFGSISSGLLARTDITAAAKFDERRGPDLVFRLHR